MAEVALLVDTDVLVDFFRGSPHASEWVSDHHHDMIGIPVIVLMELLQGARSPAEQRAIRERLARFSIEHLESGDSQLALDWFSAYRLSHGTGIMDCLIATAATRLRVPLFTFNVRHFMPIPAIDARQPYDRPPATDQKNAPDEK